MSKEKYYARRDDSGDAWEEIEAYDIGDAAEEFAQILWGEHDGPEFMPDREVEIQVRRKRGRPRKFYIVTEFEPTFTIC